MLRNAAAGKYEAKERNEEERKARWNSLTLLKASLGK
jgi:hypothetical protein